MLITLITTPNHTQIRLLICQFCCLSQPQRGDHRPVRQAGHQGRQAVRPGNGAQVRGHGRGQGTLRSGEPLQWQQGTR